MVKSIQSTITHLNYTRTEVSLSIYMYMYMHWRAIPNNNWMAKPHRSGQVRIEGAMLVSSPVKSRTYICKLDGGVKQLVVRWPH